MAGRRSGRHKSLSTRLHRRHTHTHVSAYKTARMAGRRSGRHKSLCTRLHRRHTLTSLPTRPHRWLVAGQGDTHTHTYTNPCLPDLTDGWWPVRETHISLPTRLHRWLVAGQGDTCLVVLVLLNGHTTPQVGATSQTKFRHGPNMRDLPGVRSHLPHLLHCTEPFCSHVGF